MFNLGVYQTRVRNSNQQVPEISHESKHPTTASQAILQNFRKRVSKFVRLMSHAPIRIQDRHNEKLKQRVSQSQKLLGRPVLHINNTHSDQERIETAIKGQEVYKSPPIGEKAKVYETRPRKIDAEIHPGVRINTARQKLEEQLMNHTGHYFTRDQALGTQRPRTAAAEKAKLTSAVDRLKLQRKLRKCLEIPQQPLFQELHNKSYFKTSAEIALNFGSMDGMKNREFMEDFIQVAFNLVKQSKEADQWPDDAALINYLQKMYGQNVDFNGLAQSVLKQANFVRSPAEASMFLRRNSGKGGWGKRPESMSGVPGTRNLKSAKSSAQQSHTTAVQLSSLDKAGEEEQQIVKRREVVSRNQSAILKSSNPMSSYLI